MSKRLNAICKQNKDKAVKNFILAGILSIPLIFAYWVLFHAVSTEQHSVAIIACVVLTIPVIFCLAKGFRGLLSLKTYGKYYNPYEEE